MLGRTAQFVPLHRGAIQQDSAGLSLDQAAEKIAERLNGAATGGDADPAKPDSRGDQDRSNGEDTRRTHSEAMPADPLDIDDDPDADLLPDDADDGADPEEDPGPEADARQADDDLEVDVDADPLDDGEEPAGPRSFYDVAEALGVEPAALATMEVPIKVQGQARTATLKEVIRGYQRMQDYSVKTAALAKERAELEGSLTKAREGLSARLERFDLLATRLEQKILGDKKQLTDELYDTDPDRYRRLERDVTRNSELFEEAARERVEHLKEHLAEERKKVQSKIVEEFGKLQERHPKHFGSEGRAKKTMGRLQGFAQDAYGIPAAEFNAIDSAAHVEVLMDALRWRSLQQRKPTRKKQVANAPKMGRAGRAADRGQNQAAQRKRSLSTLKRSGSLRDAAKALADLGIV